MAKAFVTDVKQEMPGWVARIYARQIAAGSHSIYERMVDEVASRVGDVERVVDLGCGPGHATELLARRYPGANVIGVDLSDVFVSMAREQRRPLANLSFELGNAVDCRFGDGEFDLAVSFLSIKAWPDRQKGVAEMARIVRPGGRVALFECDPDCTPEAAHNFCSLWRMNMGLSGAATSRMGRAWYFRRFVASEGCRAEDFRTMLEASGLTGVETCSWKDQPFAFGTGRKL